MRPSSPAVRATVAALACFAAPAGAKAAPPRQGEIEAIELAPASSPTDTSTEAAPDPQPTPEVEPDDDRDTTVVDLDGDDGGFARSITVGGGGAAARDEELAGSDFDIDLEHMDQIPRGSAERLLPLAPGVFISNSGGEGHASGVFLRGFDAAEGQDFEMLVDEIPVNDVSNPHNHGYADTNFVIPELITHVRVIEGPFDARQGDFSVAGSAKFDLGLRERGVTLRQAYGSFNSSRTLLMWGPEKQSEGTFVAADFKRSDGFGINRASWGGRLWGSFEHDFGDGLSVRARTWGYATRWDQAGVIRRDDLDDRAVPGCGDSFDEQFFCSYDDNQGGSNVRTGASVALRKRGQAGEYEQRVWVLHRNMRIRENFTGFLVDLREGGLEQRGDLAEQSYRAITYGTRGSYRMRRQWWRRPQDFELGFGLRYDDGRGDQRRLRAVTAVPYRVDFDNEIGVLDLSTYASTTLRPTDRLTLGVGGRVDLFHFSVIDHDAPETDRDGERLPRDAREATGVAGQPRVTLGFTLGRWNGRKNEEAAEAAGKPMLGWGQVDWLSSYGIGNRSSDATALSDGESAPFSRVQAAETGLRWRWDGIADRLGFELRSMGFYTHVDRELVFDPERGRNTLGLLDPITGERLLASNRYGLLESLRVRFDDWMDLMASFTWSEAYLRRQTAGFFEWSTGPRLPYIPRFVTRLDATVFHSIETGEHDIFWSIGAGASHVAPRPLPLNTFGEPYFVVDLGARMRWRFIESGIEIKNLLDARYYEAQLNYASNFEGPSSRPSRLPVLHFNAGAPISAMGVLTLYLGELTGRQGPEGDHELD